MKRILLFLALASCALAGTWIAAPGKGSHASAGTSLLTSLVAYYKMDEASGSLTDIHGSKTLTESGTVNATTGKISGARIPNDTGAFATRADDTSFEPGSGNFFVTMWVKPSSLTQAASPSMFGKYTMSGNQCEWTVLFRDTTNAPQITATPDGIDANGTDCLSGTAFPDTSTFVFVAAGWDGTNLKISVNGGAFTNAAYTGTVFAGTALVQMFRRGADVSFQGAVDEVAFWKGRCLTLAEAQTIYNSGAGKAYSTW